MNVDSNDQFHRLFAASPSATALHELICDATGRPVDYRFLDVNPAFEAMTGLRRRDLVGRTVLAVLPQTEPELIRRYGEVALSGQSAQFENFSGPLGRWFEVQAFRYDERKFAVICQDITARKEAERDTADQHAFQQLLLETVPSPIYYKDTGGIIRGCNQALLDFFGRTREAIVGQPLGELLPAPLIARMRAWDGDLLVRGGHQEYQLAIRAAGGRLREVLFHKGTFTNAQGEVAGLVGVIIDLTDRLAAEKDLRNALAQAKFASAAKSQFLSTMSHEIRTPLTGIIGLSDMLLVSGLTAEQADMARILQNCGRSLLAVIGDILDLAKIESGQALLDQGMVDIRQLTEEVHGMFTATALTKGLRCTVAVDPGLPRQVVGDAVQLRQVLINLVGNALKFTERGEVCLRVGLGPLPSGAPGLSWEVQDTGPGIAADYLPHLFVPFSQADGGFSRRHGGTGLGLAIAKRIVDLMGGALGVNTELGRGTRFRFTLPLAIEAGEDATASRTAVVADRIVWTRPPTVLVAEDDPICRFTIQLMLKELGCTCLAVEDGSQAITAVTAAPPPDLVLMDCQMPGCDGYAATRAIRAHEVGRESRLPIIAVTANAFTEDRERCEAAGMDDFIAKPCSLDVLRSRILHWAAGLRATG